MFGRSKHPALLREVVVNLSDGETALRGILYDVKRTKGVVLYVLRNAAMLTASAERPSPVDGEIIIDKDRVLFMQAV